MTNALQKNYEAYLKLINLTDKAEKADGQTLRRAALTLHRWYEHECNGAIQRDGDDCQGDHGGSARAGGRSGLLH